MAELNDFLFSIVTYATMGLMPKDFETYYKGSEAENQINILKPMIIEGIHAYKAAECLQICTEMIHMVEPYLVYLLENLTQEDQDQLDNADDSNEYTTSEEKDHNTKTTTSTHFKPEPKNQDKNEEKREDIQKEKSHTQNEEKSDSDKQDENDEAPDENSDGAGREESSDNESDDQNSDADPSFGDNESSSKNDNDDSKNKDKSGGNLSDGNAEEDSTDEKDTQKDGESRNDSPDEDNNSGEDNDADKDFSKEENSIPDEELVSKAIEDLLQDIESEVKGQIKDSERESKKKEDDGEEPAFNQEELKALEAQYKKESIRKFYEVRGFRLFRQMPEQMKREAKRFRKEIETIFRNKEALTQRGQKRGVIDANSLYKVGAKDYNVFVKRGTPITSDYVAYLLWDGSGSMSEGNKEFHSGHAVAIAEEGLKGIIPFKVSQFTVDWHKKSVVHHVVKGFNEIDSSLNYAHNFLYHRSADGGNKDGYSIRIATKELMKRPEKDRILIIFSDGLPSDYNGGYEEGMVDVKEAVKEARAKGIFVVSLLFGTESFRDLNIEMYKYMYQKNIISCEPSQITPQLIRVLKKVIAR
jgi:nitric oxide reductase activation protein